MIFREQSRRTSCLESAVRVDCLSGEGLEFGPLGEGAEMAGMTNLGQEKLLSPKIVLNFKEMLVFFFFYCLFCF